MSNLRHIQIPNELIGTENIEPKDLVIYLALKSFDGKDCFPGIRTLVELTGANQRTVRKSIKNLENSGWIECQKGGNGVRTKYTFKKFLEFEPFSYEFLKRTDLTFMEKAYYISQQQFMFKNSVNEGAISLPIQVISKNINMPISTIYKCEKGLKNKGLMEIHKTKAIDKETGCKVSVRYYDFEKFGQAVAYALRNHDERISTVEDQQKEMYEKLLALEKRLNIVTQENKELKEQLDKSSKTQIIL